jgi:hypothetical protein
MENSEFNRITVVSNVKGGPASCLIQGFLAKDRPFEMIKFGNASDINDVDDMLYTARTSTHQGKLIGTITPKIDGYGQKPVNVSRKS